MAIIYCTKLKTQAEGLEEPPFQDDLGQRIYEQISQEVWNQWLDQQTRLINEYRLNTLDPNARQLLRREMKQFLFDE
jgi:Fe-S cluster biosynthesis and repair protein YggX